MPQAARQKRPRALQACDVCRIRKNRCSEDRPCTYCVEHDLECTYQRDKRQKAKPTRQVRDNALNTELRRPSPGFTPNFTSIWSNSLKRTAAGEEHSEQDIGATEDGRLQPPMAVDSPALDATRRTTSTKAPGNTTSEVLDTNLHTSSLEFYGSASSVAFLRHVETLSNGQTSAPTTEASRRSLASLLHNVDFNPGDPHITSSSSQSAKSRPDRFYFRVARPFLDAYFSNIHHIEPLFDEDVFLTRCEDLWFGKSSGQPLSFHALYCATLSLGSLVMIFENSEISGLDRFSWSRKLFNDALLIVTQLGTATDLEMVHCYYMMSKVCQHELNPHVAYLYSGQAARTSLAIGINRKPANSDVPGSRTPTAASRAWWAVYCLDIQTSFALGRPDSLGPDQYHTQHLPVVTQERLDSKVDSGVFVFHMVKLSRIMRKVALEMYTQSFETEKMIHKARELDAELIDWLGQVPSQLRAVPEPNSKFSLKPRRLPSYIKKQSAVLRLRYLNLRMVIHAVFMIDAKPTEQNEVTLLRECQCRCIQSAEDAIDLIYTIFRTDEYFQTWWYNSTYALYAVSILLAVVFRQLARTKPALENLFVHIDRAIVVLQAMDDCLVARNAASIIKRALARAKRVPQPALVVEMPMSLPDATSNDPMPSFVDGGQQASTGNFNMLLQTPVLNDIGLDGAAGDLNWLDNYPFDNSQQALFWTEWAHEIDTLGTQYAESNDMVLPAI